MYITVPQIVLLVVFLLITIFIIYNIYMTLFVKTENEITATTNKFNNMHHRSEFDKSVSYHSFDNA